MYFSHINCASPCTIPTPEQCRNNPATAPCTAWTSLFSAKMQRAEGCCGLCKMQRAEGMQGCSCTVQVSEQYRDMPNLEKYNLVLQCLIGSIAAPISFKLLILCNRIPVKISTATLNVRSLFILVSGFRFARLTVRFSLRSIWSLNV